MKRGRVYSNSCPQELIYFSQFLYKEHTQKAGQKAGPKKSAKRQQKRSKKGCKKCVKKGGKKVYSCTCLTAVLKPV